MSEGRAPGLGFLIGTLLAAETLGIVATTTLSTVAPNVAAAYGINPSLIGYQISLLVAFILVSLVFGSHFSVRWGGCRVTQIALALMMVGCLLAILPWVMFVFSSAITLGLGYGLLAPPASQLLARFTPQRSRNLAFSLKQTGAPLGGVLAALIAPAVAVNVGWQWAFVGNALMLSLLILALQRARSHWDDDRDSAAKIAVNPLAGIAIIWKHPVLRLLSVSGGCFVIVQICVQTFTVVLFVDAMQVGLITAGLVLAASQVGGILGRIFWGWVADASRDPFIMLLVLAAAMLMTCLPLLAMRPTWPIVVSSALFFVLGSTASGWNGTFLAEVSRLAPRKEISTGTGGALFFVNIGKMIGPITFISAYSLSRSYTVAFALLALPGAIGFICVFAARQISLRPAETREDVSAKRAIKNV